MDDKVFETRGSVQSADAERHAIVTAQSDAAPAGKEPRAARQKKKFVILVVGMHRSGTSALARMLSMLGCNLPNKLEPGNPSNEPGHWESRPILLLNNEILASAGSSWDDWEAFNPAWCDSPVKDGFLERALKTLEEEFGASRLFVLKDPRICRLLPFWLEVLEAFGAAPRVVCPLRHPMEVAASLERRDGIDPSIGRLLWLRHMLDAEAHSRGLKRAFLRYDALLAGWHSLPDRLGRELGIAWPRRSSAVDIEIDGFLSPAFRHHAEEDAKVLADPNLSRWIRTSFEIFDRWARGQGGAEDWDELDQVRAAFDEAAPAFARLVLLGRQSARRSAALEGELASTREGLAGLEAVVTVKKAELAQRDAELVETQGRIGALEGVVAAREAELAQRDAELFETHGRIEALDGVVAAREAELAQRDAELFETHGRIEALDGVVAAREAELAQRDAELGEARGRIEALDEVVAAREAELAQRDVELGETRGRIEALDGVVATKEAELAAIRGWIGWLEGAVTAKEADLAQLDAELVETRGRIGALEGVVATKEAKLAQRDVELAETKGTIGELEGAVTAKEAELGGLQQAVATREAHIGSLQSTVAALRGSTSWRVTAPLRRAGLALERARYSAVGFPVTLGVRALMTWSRAPLRDYRAARTIARSKLFDRQWYLRIYPDVASLRIDPVRHYVAFGAREGRDPVPNFSSREYLAQNPDVAAAGVNPLAHYLLAGRAEERLLGPPAIPAKAPLGTSTCGCEPEEVPLTALISDRAPSLLIVDWFPPTPDQDSGSLDLWTQLRIFQAMGYTAAFMSVVEREDDMPYLKALRDVGVRVLSRMPNSSLEAMLQESAAEFDIIFLNRVHVAQRFIWMLRTCAPGTKRVFNTVDLHFLREEREAALFGSQEKIAAAACRRRDELACAVEADGVIVLSEEEGKLLAKLAPHAQVHVIPFARVLCDVGPGFSSRSGVLFVGGFLHKPNIDSATWLTKDIWPQVRRVLPNARLDIAGSNAPPAIYNLADPAGGVVVRGFVKDLNTILAQTRLTVAPLRYGAGIKGKVATSLAAGVPCVVTPIAAEGMGLTDGDDVLVARDAEEFAAAIVRLHEDAELWERLSRNGRDLMRRRYSISRIGGLLLDFFHAIGARVPVDADRKLLELQCKCSL